MAEVTDTPSGKNKREKKPRRRMKAVYNKLRDQMEFYFSDANLQKDRYLRKEIDATKDGYIPLETFLTFKRIKQLTADVTVLVEALNDKSQLLQLNSEQTHVKRVTEISEPVNVDERTVYVESLPHHVDHDWVKRLFSPCGKVLYVSLPRYHSTGDLKGFAFIEFETIEGAQAACQELNNPPANFSHRVGMFPKSSHQLESLKKKLPEDQVKATQDKAQQLIESGELTEGAMESAENNTEPTDETSIKTDATSGKSEVTDGPKSSKRRRTDSETQAQSGNTVADAGPSPTKRKKSEVTFSLPIEESSKTEEEKTTPGSAKKRNRKRKSRSRSSDEHLELNDSKEENEETPIKKTKTSESNKETDKEGSKPYSEKMAGKEQTANDKENKLKKKRFRRKKPQKDKEVPELRVIPKKEWLGLREEYLQLQKTSMALLKKSLGDVKMSCHKEEEERKEHKEIQFVPDVIVKVTADKPMKRKHLKASLGDGVQIAYVDVKEDCQDGFIRCENADSARTVCEKHLDGYSFSSVSGDEEQLYWQKLSSDRETKLTTKPKHKKRGHQKWTDKAQKASIESTEKKHIVFDDD